MPQASMVGPRKRSRVQAMGKIQRFTAADCRCLSCMGSKSKNWHHANACKRSNMNFGPTASSKRPASQGHCSTCLLLSDPSPLIFATFFFFGIICAEFWGRAPPVVTNAAVSHALPRSTCGTESSRPLDYYQLPAGPLTFMRWRKFRARCQADGGFIRRSAAIFGNAEARVVRIFCLFFAAHMARGYGEF